MSGFQTTYEELKPVRKGKISSMIALPDYLWGIETKDSTGSTTLKSSFQTTYEELKPATERLPTTSVSPCFQTTYEELKRAIYHPRLNFLLRLPDYLWGIETANAVTTEKLNARFQTTYEELKLRLSCTMVTANWLPDYLWGIETRASDIDGEGTGWLPDYLWGIETPT